jgi:prepilin-type N-terminal cleavage/methylation domain-containing protein
MNKRAAGFTLVEMLVVTLIGSIVMGTIYKMITIQDNTTRQQYAIIQNNQNARMALSVLTSELKEMSARDGDVTFADSTILEFRALRKGAIVCFKDAGNAYIDVWNFGEAFAVGDSALVFADGANVASMTDDQWTPTSVTGSGTGGNCPANDAFTGLPHHRLNLAGGSLGNVQVGALIRSFVRTRYTLADNGNGWGVINRQEGGAAAVPIIDGLATVSEGGLHMRFIDSTSAVIPYNTLRNGGARLDDIMRLQVKVRGKSAAPVTPTSNRFTDSLVTEIYVRGNARGQ